MFYDRYKELCQKRGKKPYSVPIELGAKSGDCVDQWKKGSVPRQQMLKKIADYFDVSIDYLLTGEQKTPEPKTVSDDDLKFALFGGGGEIPDEMLDEVKRFALYIKQQRGV